MDDANILIDDSILSTIKKMLGLTKDYTAFDVDISIHINSVLSNLTQMGVGPSDGFNITGYKETWTDYISEINNSNFQNIKTYIYQKVRFLFDPPSNGNLLEALKNSITENEYRLYVAFGGH